MRVTYDRNRSPGVGSLVTVGDVNLSSISPIAIGAGAALALHFLLGQSWLISLAAGAAGYYFISR